MGYYRYFIITTRCNRAVVGFQHSIGELSFNKNKKGFDSTYTVSNEVEAKKREYAISHDRYKRKIFLNQEGYLKITNERWIEAYKKYRQNNGTVDEYEHLLKKYNQK